MGLCGIAWRYAELERTTRGRWQIAFGLELLLFSWSGARFPRRRSQAQASLDRWCHGCFGGTMGLCGIAWRYAELERTTRGRWQIAFGIELLLFLWSGTRFPRSRCPVNVPIDRWYPGCFGGTKGLCGIAWRYAGLERTTRGRWQIAFGFELSLFLLSGTR